MAIVADEWEERDRQRQRVRSPKSPLNYLLLEHEPLALRLLAAFVSNNSPLKRHNKTTLS